MPDNGPDRPSTLERAVARRLARWRARGPMVVAVSGGSDSVALLQLLHSTHRHGSLIVAHLNHGTRGPDSEADARFVEELAASMSLPAVTHRWSPTRATHFEADARLARYRWLGHLAQQRGASLVAVGHTRDDQVETILHRILRGTGPTGLSGMPSSRRLTEGVRLIRPLLSLSRIQLREYLRARRLSWREDASNSDPTQTRARLRHDLLPRLAAGYNPRVDDALLRLGRLAAADRRAQRARVASQLAAARLDSDPPPGGVRLDRLHLQSLPATDLIALFRLVWRERGWSEGSMDLVRWRRLARFATTGHGRLDIGRGIWAIASPGDLLLIDTSGASPSAPLPEADLPIPGSAAWGLGRLTAQPVDPHARAPRPNLDPALSELVDLDQLEPPLSLGPPRDSERLDPLGMEGHTQSLADFLRGREVPRSRRRLVPVVRDTRGIVWVVGHRIAHRARLTDATRRALLLEWVADSPRGEPA